MNYTKSILYFILLFNFSLSAVYAGRGFVPASENIKGQGNSMSLLTEQTGFYVLTSDNHTLQFDLQQVLFFPMPDNNDSDCREIRDVIVRDAFSQCFYACLTYKIQNNNSKHRVSFVIQTNKH